MTSYEDAMKCIPAVRLSLLLLLLLSTAACPEGAVGPEPDPTPDAATEPDADPADGGSAEPDPVVDDGGSTEPDPVVDDGGSTEPDPVDAGADPDVEPPSDCLVTFCLTGARQPWESWNAAFEDLCDAPGIQETIIPYCPPGDGCYSSWGNFLANTEDLTQHVIDALDTDGDGDVDLDDEDCRLHIAGYSWGGLNSAKVAEDLLASDAVHDDRKWVHKMLVIDPFQTLAILPPPDDFLVPQNVIDFWSFRHTDEKNDCSSGSPGGPYYGIDHVCEAAGSCTDYNFTGDTQTYTWPAYTDNSAGSGVGDSLGHCTVLKASVEAGIAVLKGEPLPTPLPTPIVD